MEKEPAFYGNFAEPKEEKTSKRSEDVVLTSIERCEKLENQLKEALVFIDNIKNFTCSEEASLECSKFLERFRK